MSGGGPGSPEFEAHIQKLREKQQATADAESETVQWINEQQNAVGQGVRTFESSVPQVGLESTEPGTSEKPQSPSFPGKPRNVPPMQKGVKLD